MITRGIFGSTLAVGAAAALLLCGATQWIDYQAPVLIEAQRDDLVASAQRVLRGGSRSGLRDKSEILAAGSRLEAVRLISKRGETLLAWPPEQDFSSSESVELGEGARLDLRVAVGLAPGLVWVAGGAFGVLLVVLIWLRVFVARPLRSLRASLQILGKDDYSCRQSRAAREVAELARDLHLIGSRLWDESRASQANFERLEASFRRVRAVLDSIDQAIVVLDPKGRLVLSNTSARSILGCDEARHDASFAELDVEVARGLEAAATTALESGSTEVLRDIEIDSHVYQVSVAPIRSARASGSGVAFVFLDLTKLRQLHRMQDEFVTSVSHELRTPLTSIRSFVEILAGMEPSKGGDWQEFLGIVRKEADRLTGLVEGVLDFSRVESGDAQLEVSRFAPHELLSDVAASMAHTYSDRKQQLRVEVSSDLPSIESDPDRVRQVVTELLANASKFAPEASTVVLRAHTLSPDYIEIAVEDAGRGIPAVDRQAVFARFRQRGEITTEKPDGTGIGLALCKELVDRLGGEIRCEGSSELGGACFVLRLPVTGSS